MNDNKKVVKLVIILSLITILIIATYVLTIKIKGNKQYGKDYCLGHSYVEPVKSYYKTFRCNLCSKKYEYDYENEAAPLICEDCSKLTGRCPVCGKLLY